MCLPIHYGEVVVHTAVMRSGVCMVIEGEGALRCSINLSPKVLADSPMYSSLQLLNFLCNVIPILGGYQEVFDGVAFLEVDLDPHFATKIF